jgi:3-methylcrotonyl-CoA carboxylase alpha subunit
MINKSIHKVLIANRGEITVRIIRSLRRLGIISIAIFHELDSDALHVREADESYSLGTGELRETYLNIEKIIALALKTGADAIHPGYGFLSENPLFADACKENGIIFIGPDGDSMRLMGNKISAREYAVRCGLPVTSGISGTTEEILQKAESIGFPILVKAAAGGGGKGMRIVHEQSELAGVLEAASREALNYFGDASVYVEKFIVNPRHIEIQVLGDHHGNVVHLFERECSVQRRYQKIIEESPSPTLTPEVRMKMGEAAVKICQQIGYHNAGTIEFLVDEKMQFYFLEMNTRIQVEHPVTEMVTGIDLVEEQIRIAQGEKLRFEQKDIQQTGHSIECRIYAEDPMQNFIPSPGRITRYHTPSGKGIRLDQSLDRPTEIQSQFDPMISKLISHGKDRNEAIQLLENALQHYIIQGIHTNIPYLKYLLAHPDFRANKLHTKYCDEHLNASTAAILAQKATVSEAKIILAYLLFQTRKFAQVTTSNIWKSIGYWRHTMAFSMSLDEKHLLVEMLENNGDTIRISINGQVYTGKLISYSSEIIDIEVDNISSKVYFSFADEGESQLVVNGYEFQVLRNDQLNNAIDYSVNEEADTGNLFSPMPGKIIRIHVTEGDHVQRGTVLLVVEAMKMENNIVSPSSAIVESVNVKVGEMVDVKTQLVHLKDFEE